MVTTKEENEKMLEFIEHEEKPNNWFDSIQSLTPLIYTVAIGSVVNDIVAKSLIDFEKDKKIMTEYQEMKEKKLEEIKNTQKSE